MGHLRFCCSKEAATRATARNDSFQTGYHSTPHRQTPKCSKLHTSVKKSESSSSRSTRVVSTRPPGAGDLIRSEAACTPTVSAEICKCTPGSSHQSLPSRSHVPVGVKAQGLARAQGLDQPEESLLVPHLVNAVLFIVLGEHVAMKIEW